MLYERIRKWLYSEDEKEFTSSCDTRTVASRHSTHNPLHKSGADAREDEINQALSKFCPLQSQQKMTRISCIGHVQQQENWDCGVACLLMVWLWLRNDESLETASDLSKPRERNWVIERIGTKSIWTIDLFFLIHSIANEEYLNAFAFIDDKSTLPRGDFSYLFCSKNLKVDFEYNDYHYYQEEFQNDIDRVSRLFGRAYNDKLPLLCAPLLSVEVVVRIISQENCVAIVLLDNSFLTVDNYSNGEDRSSHDQKHPFIDNNKSGALSNTESADKQSPCPVNFRGTKSSEAYSGHYVVLCGVSTEKRHIAHALGREKEMASYCLAIKNPASVSPIQFIKPAHFERCWRSNGTDEDIIFIMQRHHNEIYMSKT